MCCHAGLFRVFPCCVVPFMATPCYAVLPCVLKCCVTFSVAVCCDGQVGPGGRGVEKVRVAVVGSSFIGMEGAAFLVKAPQVASVTVIGMEQVNLQRKCGHECADGARHVVGGGGAQVASALQFSSKLPRLVGVELE
jgi:hypothetical protein